MSDSQRHRIRELTAREAVLTETIRELRGGSEHLRHRIQYLTDRQDALTDTISDLRKKNERLTWLLCNANEMAEPRRVFDAGWHFGFDAGTQARDSGCGYDDWIEFQRIWAEDTETP